MKTIFELVLTDDSNKSYKRRVEISGMHIPPFSSNSEPVQDLVTALVECMTSGNPCDYEYTIVDMQGTAPMADKKGDEDE